MGLYFNPASESILLAISYWQYLLAIFRNIARCSEHAGGPVVLLNFQRRQSSRIHGHFIDFSLEVESSLGVSADEEFAGRARGCGFVDLGPFRTVEMHPHATV